jgi:photosystem II stability/assembly factor-like uncharacterized protein
MKTTSSLSIVAALFLCATPNRLAAQQPGSADYTFDGATANGPVFALGTTSAGYIWMGGYFNSVNNSYFTSEYNVSPSDTYFDLAVLNTNGSLDASFEFPNYSGSFSSYFTYNYADYYVSAIAVDSNDVVFVAFNYIDGFSSTIARFDPSGAGSWTLNGGFTAASKNQFTVIYSLAVDGSTVYVAGNYNQDYPGAGGYAGPLVPLNYSGAANYGYGLPAALSEYGSPYVYQVRYLSTGAGFTNNSLLVCGSFGVARISTNGSTVIASQLDGAGNAGFSCAATRPDDLQLSCPDTAGELLVGAGSSPYSPYAGINENDRVGGFELFRFGATAGNTLPVLNLSAEGQDYELARVDTFPDGSVLLCGWFDDINGTYVENWAHVLQDGTVDVNFANYVNFYIYDMSAQSDGKYVVGGINENSDYEIFGGAYGYVVRQYGGLISGGGALTFITQPTPSNVVAYPGDFLDVVALVSLPFGVNFQWTQDGTNAPGQTGEDLDIDSVAASDAGAYQLVVNTNSLCPRDVVSSNMILTVLAPPPPPPNDMFANAAILTGTNTVASDYIRDSTEESGEPNHANASDGHSVWYGWTAPGSGFVTIAVYSNDFPAAIGVYTGTAVDDLTLITNDACPYEGGGGDATPADSCDGVTGSVTFFAFGGTTYQIAVGGPFELGSLDTFDLSLDESLSSGDVGPGAGTSWRQVYSNPDYYLDGVAYGCGELVAVGYSDIILDSPDAFNWTPVDISLDYASGINCVNFGKGLFLGGTYGQIAVSTNGSQWNLDNLALNNNNFNGSVYARDIYVNAGSDGTLMTSPDGITWTVQDTNAAANPYDSLYSVTYGNGLFVAVGDEGSVVTSPDGTNWSLASSYQGVYPGDSFYSIAFGKGLFVAVGDDGSIVTSPDASNWTLQATNVTEDNELYGVAFGDGRFVAVGNNGMIVLSTDGVNWVQDASGEPGVGLTAVTYFRNGQYVIVTDDGTILVNQLPTFTAINNIPGFGLQVTLLGLSGATAIVQASPTLAPPDWQPFLTNIFTNSTIIFTNSPADQARFYRAVVR